MPTAAGSPLRPSAYVYEPVTESRADLSWLAKRRFRFGQTHGRLLQEKNTGLQRLKQIGLAAAKAVFCYGAALACIFSPIPRYRYALRGAHAYRGRQRPAGRSRNPSVRNGGGRMTQTLPDVSFIVAAYNAAGTLAKAIDSALAQRGVSVEVIVADDCSTDETRAIAESYADRNVKLLALARNGGPAAARNAALVGRDRPLACGARFRRHRRAGPTAAHDRARREGGCSDRRRQSPRHSRRRHAARNHVYRAIAGANAGADASRIHTIQRPVSDNA